MKKWGLLFCLFSGNLFANSLTTDLEGMDQIAKTDRSQAIFVLTADTIRRSGYTNLPDLLRLVPGVQVARIQSNQWAVSIRGFNERFSNKVMVLIDDRPVYNPLFGGTFWESNEMMLEDIERIEVIRGVPDAQYGANSLNGVIRVVTKKAADTSGGHIVGGGGSEEHGFVTARVGGGIGDANVRVYTKMINRDRLYSSTNNPNDDWWGTKSGFRVDSELSDSDSLTLSGDYSFSDIEQRLTYPTSTGATGTTVSRTQVQQHAADLSLGWNHDFGEKGSLESDLFYDFWRRNDPTTMDAYLNFFRGNVAYHLPEMWSQSLTVGTGYQLYRDDVTGKRSGPLSFTESQVTDSLFSLYIKDETALIPDLLLLTLSAGLEKNEFTGVEHLENARLAWWLNDQNTLWLTAGRSVRTPNRFQDAGELFAVNAAGTSNILFKGSKTLRPERVFALGTGYRSQLTEKLNIDLAGFYHWYQNLLTQNLSGTTATFGNEAKAAAWGGEAAVDFAVHPRWSLIGSYSLLKIDVTPSAGNFNKAPASVQSENPQHMLGLWSRIDFDYGFEADIGGRWVSALDHFAIDNYAVADARISWMPTDDFTFTLVGQNLFVPHHEEFGDEYFVTGGGLDLVEQSIYAKFDWMF